MTTKELYRKHKSGDISNQKFLYEVRRDAKLPWINNLTSYEDAVKILKNKGIINEAEDGKQDVVVIAKTVDMVNPYEYANGLDYELGQSMVPVRCDLTEDEVLAAQKKVLNNLTKDPNYYTKVMNGLKPKDPILGPHETEVTEKSIEAVKKGPVKADGYIKKELKKDAKANVKDNLGDSEKAPKKPKGVEEFKDKGVTGSFKTIKEGIEEIIREKLAKKKADEAKVEESPKPKADIYGEDPNLDVYADKDIPGQGLTEAKVKVGDIVIPNKGPHKGQKHQVIHVFDDGTFNIKPVGLKAANIKYKLGAAKAKPEDIELSETKVDEHHNDPNFPVVKGLYELLDAIVADWGKEDLYHDVEDVVVAYIEPDATAISKEAVKKIKDVLENYDVLEDYAELVNGIAVKEPGTGLRPGVDLGSSFEKLKASLKEKLKADVKKEALVVPKATPVDQIKKYQAQGVDVKLDVK